MPCGYPCQALLAETFGVGSTRYLHLDVSLCDAIKAERRKHIFFPVHDPYKATDEAVLQQLDAAVQGDEPWTGSVTYASGHSSGELLTVAVPMTNPAEHATSQPVLATDASISTAESSLAHALPGALLQAHTPVTSPPPPADPRQLTLLVHGSAKRLHKGATDAASHERLLRTMQMWARAHCLVSVHNGSVHVTSVAHALCTELGYTSAEVLGSDLSVFIGPGTKAKLAAALVRCWIPDLWLHASCCACVRCLLASTSLRPTSPCSTCTIECAGHVAAGVCAQCLRYANCSSCDDKAQL